MPDLNHPIDDRPDDAAIEYWHGDQTDFRGVTTALQYRQLLPSDADHITIGDAFRHSRALQAHAALYAAHLILDPDRLQAILGQAEALAPAAVARAEAEGQPFAGSHLIAAIATLIRDTPATHAARDNVEAILDTARGAT